VFGTPDETLGFVVDILLVIFSIAIIATILALLLSFF